VADQTKAASEASGLTIWSSRWLGCLIPLTRVQFSNEKLRKKTNLVACEIPTERNQTETEREHDGKRD